MRRAVLSMLVCTLPILGCGDGGGGGSSNHVWKVDIDAAAGGDGLTWATAFQHPQDAMDVASEGDEVWVAEGIYTRLPETEWWYVLKMEPQVSIYGGFAGTEDQRSLRNWATHATILDGEDLCWHVVIGVSDARLDGFTVTRGAADSGGSHETGGGMYNAGISGLTVANCTFSSNNAIAPGGGILNVFSSVAISDCDFLDNTAHSGAAIYNDASTGVTVKRCTFDANVAQSGSGGAIGFGFSSGTVEDCAFWNNSALVCGGAIVVSNKSSGEIMNCVFSGNQVTGTGAGYGGGAIQAQVNFSAKITNCTFAGNTAANSVGGGIRSYNTGKATLVNCILWDNAAAADDEISVDGTSSCSAIHSDVKGGYSGAGNMGTDLILDEPLFVDADGTDNIMGTDDDNLRLQATSPCIDAGTDAGAPDHDLDGDSRPAGSDYDMGAYEQ